MNRLIMIMLLCFGMVSLSSVQAQDQKDQKVSSEEYQRMLQNKLQVEFRSFAINALELTEEEINDFDPLLMDYLDNRADLADKRHRLMREHADEMSEDNSASSAADETADFIENYWEIEIAEMELKKDFFDKLEDEIPVSKAAQFFLLDDIIQNRMKQRVVMQAIPVAVIQKIPVAFDRNDEGMKRNKDGKMAGRYKTDIEAYQKWLDTKGEVTIDHHYTHKGITKLVNAVSALAHAGDAKIDNFSAQKKDIMQLADELKKNPMTDVHADKTHKAFSMITDLMKSVQNSNDEWAGLENSVAKLTTAADAINPDKLLTNQADEVHAFFEKAGKAINYMTQNMTRDGMHDTIYNR